MPLIHDTYGKGRVRVMRVARGERDEVRELSARIMLQGAAFSAAYTRADNSAVVATDTIKNMAYIVARENLDAEAEPYGLALARRFLDRSPQVERVAVTLLETRWTRYAPGGEPHPHAFLLDGNGKGYARLVVDRRGQTVESGVRDFSFLKSTQSGWENYVRDEYTTLPETRDRVAATAMDATWRWAAPPDDHPAANRRVLDTVLAVFAGTYSHGIQDSLYRMGEAALDAVPELAEVHMAGPNKHYIAFNLAPFGMSADNQVFVATDEPHGQIECRVGRG